MKARITPLVLVALVLPVFSGVIALHNHFEGLYGQDSFAYYDYATVALRDQLFPPPPFFWPPGYPLLVLLATVFAGVTPLAGQLVSLLGGSLTVFGTMLITRESFDGYFVPVITGLVISFASQLNQSSIVVMADTVGLAAATLGMWGLMCYERQRHPRWLMLAAGLIAFAIIARWGYAVLALVAAAYTLILWRKQTFKTVLTHALLAAAVVALILGPVLLAALMSPRDLGTTFGGSFQYQLVYWNPINAFQRDFINPDGHETYPTINSLYYAALPAFFMTPLLTAFFYVGVVVALRRRILFPLMAWGAVAYLLVVGSPQQNIRFALTYLPPVAVLMGAGLGEIWQRNRFKKLMLVFLGLALCYAGWNAYDYTQKFINRNTAVLSLVRWTESQLSPDAQVITLGPTLMMRHYTALETHEIYSLTENELEIITAEEQPTYLLLDLYTVENQWKDRSPSLNYHWLQRNTLLSRMGRYGGYTLFRVFNR